MKGKKANKWYFAHIWLKLSGKDKNLQTYILNNNKVLSYLLKRLISAIHTLLSHLIFHLAVFLNLY